MIALPAAPDAKFWQLGPNTRKTEDRQMSAAHKGESPSRDSTNRKERAVGSPGQNTVAPRVGLTQNSGEDSETRCRQNANLKPWPKGVSGNPGGRPKKQPITEAYLAVAGRGVPGNRRGLTYAQVAAERQFRAALKGSTLAIREIADRIEGKPRQSIDMTHHEDFLAGRSTEDKEFFAVHGYWPNEEPAKDGKA